MELIDELNTCIDEQFAAPSYLQELKDEGYRINRMLNGYIAYLKRERPIRIIQLPNQLNKPNQPNLCESYH